MAQRVKVQPQKTLCQLFRKASVSRLLSLSHQKPVELHEVSSDLEYGERSLAAIMVSGQEVKITFQAYFSSDAARFFSKLLYGQSEERISSAQAADFVGELCNTIAGQIKMALDNNSIHVNLGLPNISPQKQNCHLCNTKNKNVFYDNWELKSHDATIICSVKVELNSNIKIKDETIEADDSGDIVFL